MSPQEKVDKGIVIAVHPNGRWWCKVYAYDATTKKDKSEWKLVRVKCEHGRAENKRKARRLARQLADEKTPSIGKNENTNRKFTIAEPVD